MCNIVDICFRYCNFNNETNNKKIVQTVILARGSSCCIIVVILWNKTLKTTSNQYYICYNIILQILAASATKTYVTDTISEPTDIKSVVFLSCASLFIIHCNEIPPPIIHMRITHYYYLCKIIMNVRAQDFLCVMYTQGISLDQQGFAILLTICTHTQV